VVCNGIEQHDTVLVKPVTKSDAITEKIELTVRDVETAKANSPDVFKVFLLIIKRTPIYYRSSFNLIKQILYLFFGISLRTPFFYK